MKKFCERLLLKISMSVTNLEAVVQKCSVKKVFLEILQNSLKKQLCNCLFFNKVAGLRLFPVNFVKFLRTPFIIEQLRWLLLFSYKHDIFIIKKLQHFYHKEVLTHIKWNVMISSSLRFVESVNLIQMWKLKIITMMKNNYFFMKKCISKHRAIRRMFL